MSETNDNQLDRIERLLNQTSARQREIIESRLSRLESLMSQSGPLTLDNRDRIHRLENFGVRAGELIEQNASSISQLTDAIVTYKEQFETDRQRFEEHQRTTEAALAKIDRVLDYLMQQAANDD